MSDTILVVVEQREGKLNRVSWETLTLTHWRGVLTQGRTLGAFARSFGLAAASAVCVTALGAAIALEGEQPL